MAQVELFKKKVDYVDKDGKERTATNFSIKVGDALIPIEVKYFKDKETGLDNQYLTRKGLLTAMADTLPKKVESKSNDTSDDLSF